MSAKSAAHDVTLMGELTSKAGDKYAALCALAYRQTLAATKLVWSADRGVVWNFLKEVSTNGDMQVEGQGWSAAAPARTTRLHPKDGWMPRTLDPSPRSGPYPSAITLTTT